MDEHVINILHIEDDDGDAKIIHRACLKEFGRDNYRLTRVQTMVQGLNEIQAQCYSVILLDLNLGDTTGVNNIKLIKRENPDIPIVVLSGHNDTETALHAIRAGAQEYMVKDHITSRSIGLGLLTSIERKKYERELFEQANHDQLTGLANRRAFMDHMIQWLVRAKRWERTECIMFMDVNHFKSVNDTYGHKVGDELLQKVAAILKKTLRGSDLLARYGGDEFIVHLDVVNHELPEVSIDFMNRITKAFNQPINIDDLELQVGMSIGSAFFPQDGENIEALIQSADQAMYQAKNK
jgi:two-component system cell cycle response regulator